MTRSSFIILGFIFLGALLSADTNQAAEQYPAKPIMFIVPTEAGADIDILVRPLVQKASAILGKPIVIVNKPGAGTGIGSLEVHGAKPDGYVIGVGVTAMLTSKLTGVSRLNYPDFTLLGTFYRMPASVFGSMKTKHPFKTIEEVISFAKAHPGEVSLATAAIGQNLWVLTMAFMSGTGINLNVIPQPGGGGLAITQVAGGHADLAITHLGAAKAQIEAGNVRFLAVMGPERAPGYENVPALKELGYNIGWESNGFFIGPPKMPKDVTDRLTKVFEMAANDPEYHKFLYERFAMPFYLPPDKMIDHLDGQSKILRDIMGKAGILKEK